MVLPILTMELLTDAVIFIIELVVTTIAFYVAGRLLSGVNAKLTDAFFVALIGLFLQFVLDTGLNFILVTPGLNEIVVFAWNMVGLLTTFIVWMILVQHFFDCQFIRGFLIVTIGFFILLVLDYGLQIVLDIILPIIFP